MATTNEQSRSTVMWIVGIVIVLLIIGWATNWFGLATQEAATTPPAATTTEQPATTTQPSTGTGTDTGTGTGHWNWHRLGDHDHSVSIAQSGAAGTTGGPSFPSGALPRRRADAGRFGQG